MNYNETNQAFNNYIEECKNKIINTFFKDDVDFNQVAPDIIMNNPETPFETKENRKNRLIQTHRLEMIKLKLNHTMRMISEIIKTNDFLGLKFDFKTVLKIAILYHDIGRFDQATWTGDYRDTEYKNRGKVFTNHGEFL